MTLVAIIYIAIAKYCYDLLQLKRIPSKRSYRNSIGRNSQLNSWSDCSDKTVATFLCHFALVLFDHIERDVCLKYWIIINLLVLLVVRVRVWFPSYGDIVGHCCPIFTGCVINPSVHS
jgi:hypothetical protein